MSVALREARAFSAVRGGELRYVAFTQGGNNTYWSTGQIFNFKCKSRNFAVVLSLCMDKVSQGTIEREWEININFLGWSYKSVQSI